MTCFEEILKLHVDILTPIKFQLNQHVFLKGKSFQEFQDGCHVGRLDV